jgi:hypothetical protein
MTRALVASVIDCERSAISVSLVAFARGKGWEKPTLEGAIACLERTKHSRSAMHRRC